MFDKYAYLLLTVLIKKISITIFISIAVKALFDIKVLDFMDFEIFSPYRFWQVF